ELIVTTALLYAVIATVATDTAERDLIVNLPGLDVQPEFKQYSGYVSADGYRQFHYWLVESQRNPEQDPLILWLNGGPGCSSISGFLVEHGPFTSRYVNQLNLHLHFSQNANVVYLESPGGVGYSYSPSSNVNKTGDYHSAENNYFAMRSFFEKFPAFKGRAFYITGESYAGIYVPLLAHWVTSDDDMNLKGIAIGNGVLDLAFDLDSLPQMLYSHGMISTDLWVLLRAQCCQKEHAFGCSFTSSLEFNPSVCQRVLENVVNLSWTSGVNPYNVLDSCAGGAESVMPNKTEHNHRAKMNYNFDKKVNIAVTEVNARENPIENEIEENVISCLNDTLTTNYMNLPEVREALHIPRHLAKWQICNENITTEYERQVSTVKEQILELLSKDIRVLIYNGETDLACNVIGNAWFVSDLGLKREHENQAWFYEDTLGNSQIGGFIDRYQNLDFVTFRGAGHFVPADKPSLALQVINSFIDGDDY
ncbi:hypothetical protein CAPTEDRAFT_32896, partial [Capitella teleta]